MNWVHDVAYFFGGLFLTNGAPHWMSGVMGRPLQSPFAKPPGVGLSSSTVNAVWGAFNFAVAYLLLFRVGSFDLRNPEHVGAAGLAALLGSIQLARRLGRFHGGNDPLKKGA